MRELYSLTIVFCVYTISLELFDLIAYEINDRTDFSLPIPYATIPLIFGIVLSIILTQIHRESIPVALGGFTGMAISAYLKNNYFSETEVK